MSQHNVNNPASQIERLLVEIEKAHPDQRNATSAIRDQLKVLTGKLRPSPKRRTGEETTYSVDGSAVASSLAETRASGQTLRAPKEVFDRVVDALAAADRPLGFDDLMSSMRGDPDVPADWQVRVVLRFLLNAEPAVLHRSRSRYHPVASRTLKAGAERWWKATSKHSTSL